jgi:hypothetical protein
MSLYPVNGLNLLSIPVPFPLAWKFHTKGDIIMTVLTLFIFLFCTRFLEIQGVTLSVLLLTDVLQRDFELTMSGAQINRSVGFDLHCDSTIN